MSLFASGVMFDPSIVRSNLLPLTAASYDLGSASLTFRHGYFSGNITLAGNVVSSAGDFQIDGTGKYLKVLHGKTIHADLSSLLGNQTAALLTGDAAAGSELVLAANGNNGNSNKILGFKTRSTNLDADVASLNGEVLLYLGGYGADGAAYRQAGYISLEQDGNAAAGTSMPGRFVVATTASGSITPSIRWRVDSAGDLTSDSTNGGHVIINRTTRFLQVLQGKAIHSDVTAVNTGSTVALMHASGSSGTDMFLIANGTSSNSNRIFALKTRHASDLSADTIVADGDPLLSIHGYGADGSAYKPGAQISMFVDGTPGTNQMGSKISFLVSPVGSAAVATVLDLKPNRWLQIYERAAAPSSNPVASGYLYVESGALKYRGTSGTITTVAAA